MEDTFNWIRQMLKQMVWSNTQKSSFSSSTLTPFIWYIFFALTPKPKCHPSSLQDAPFSCSLLQLFFIIKFATSCVNLISLSPSFTFIDRHQPHWHLSQFTSHLFLSLFNITASILTLFDLLLFFITRKKRHKEKIICHKSSFSSSFDSKEFNAQIN